MPTALRNNSCLQSWLKELLAEIMKEESELERLAAEELLLEAKRGQARANVCGPTGWKRCPLPGANKKFLHNTIKNVVSSNKLKEQKFERNLEKGKYLIRQEYVSRSHRKTETKLMNIKDGRRKSPKAKVDKDELKKRNSPVQTHQGSHQK